jgi:hypothetical protein
MNAPVTDRILTQEGPKLSGVKPAPFSGIVRVVAGTILGAVGGLVEDAAGTVRLIRETGGRMTIKGRVEHG